MNAPLGLWPCANESVKRPLPFPFLVMLCVVLVAAAPTGSARGQHLEGGGPVLLGDPTLIHADGCYTVFGSGPGLSMFRSTDLVTWRSAGRMFATLPDWANHAVPGNAGYVWAPDVVKLDDEYRVYWSTSTLGSRQSVIGFASNRTLDPSSPQYRWVDRGKVIQTTPADNWNAIDPQCFADQQGNVWLLMGSYWSGIKLRRLDRQTGLLSSADARLHSLAGRPNVRPPSVEGAYLLWRDGFYYLFVSFDSCTRGIHSDYNIRVGRSREITGPYVDLQGRPMLDSGGTLVLASHGSVRGPGHNCVYQHEGQTWLACHFFDPALNGRRRLQVRPVYWDDRGWPLAGEPVGGTKEKPPSPAGKWAYSLDFDEPMTLTLTPQQTIAAPVNSGSWNIEDGRMVLTWRHGDAGHHQPLVERCFLSADETALVGRNRFGQIVRGVRLGP